MKIIYWILRLVAAVILLQTLWFKFTGAEESVALFTKLGVEPWGRWLTGIVELVASVLILWPRTTGIGALLAAGTMVGAIASHIMVIGIESAGDGGQLFRLAIIVLIASLVLAWGHKHQLLRFLRKA